MGLAEVVHHDVKCGEEGVQIDHWPVPFPSGSGSKPTLNRGHLPLKFSTDNSHQAFDDISCVELKDLCCQSVSELKVELVRKAKERLRHEREDILGRWVVPHSTVDE